MNINREKNLQKTEGSRNIKRKFDVEEKSVQRNMAENGNGTIEKNIPANVAVNDYEEHKAALQKEKAWKEYIPREMLRTVPFKMQEEKQRSTT